MNCQLVFVKSQTEMMLKHADLLLLCRYPNTQICKLLKISQLKNSILVVFVVAVVVLK